MAKRVSSSAGLQLVKFSTTPKKLKEPTSKRKKIETPVVESETKTQKTVTVDKGEPKRRTKQKKTDEKEPVPVVVPEKSKKSPSAKKKDSFVPTDGNLSFEDISQIRRSHSLQLVSRQ